MYMLFDEAGKFLAGRILSEAEASAQVELDSGKRVKVKAANQLLRFDKPAPAELLAQAESQATDIDPALAWEFAPEGEFGFAELAADYFGAKSLADTYHADYALFSRAAGNYASGGRVAMMIGMAALGVSVPLGGQQMYVSLVDLHTGRVVWFNYAMAGPNADMRTPAGAASLVTDVMKTAPL